MKKFLIMLCVILGIAHNSFSQEKKTNKASQKLLPIVSDCKGAIKIPFVKKGTYGPTVAPNGTGDVNEIKSSKKNDSYSFEREHNSAWYYFTIVQDGDLVIEITPSNPNDDYDFMLFKYTDSTFFGQLVKNKIKPVRTNISRSGKGEGNGMTGLSSSGKSEFMHAGPGEAFSKSLQVKKGEKYYLVLDNVYPDGSGHTITLGYEKVFEISGTVLGEDQKPLKAEVVLEDAKGNTVQKTESDSLGKYQMSVPLWEASPYTISFIEDSSFVESKNFNTTDLVKAGYKMNNLRTVLPKLKGGKKYALGGINFYGDSPELLPESYPSVNALLKLMKRNKKMVIRIEGHVNDPGNRYSQESDQILSEGRAETVYSLLISNGIESERMSKIGFGNKKMLYPKPKNLEENFKNMRVEINVISIK